MIAELPQAVLRRTMDFAQLQWYWFFEVHEKCFEYRDVSVAVVGDMSVRNRGWLSEQGES